jgi:hypothetical protein
MIILKWILQGEEQEDVNWKHQAQNSEHCQKPRGNFMPNYASLASPETLLSIELVAAINQRHKLSSKDRKCRLC